FIRGADGMFVGPGGTPFQPELRGTIQNETAILADSWKRAGIDVQLSITPAALATNNQYRSEFPAFAITNSHLTDTTVATKFGTEFIATPENKYGGTNKGGYSNPDLDKLYTAFNNALDINERNKYYIGINKIVSEQVPGIPLYYQQ